jgi:hypothetical protein
MFRRVSRRSAAGKTRLTAPRHAAPAPIEKTGTFATVLGVAALILFIGEVVAMALTQ